MSLGILLLIIIGIALVILMTWNLVSLNQIKKHGKTDRDLNDPRYYELKYKQEFFIATVSLVGSVLVIFGYNSIQNVEKALTDDFKIKTENMSRRTDSIIKNFDTSVTRKINNTEISLQTISENSTHIFQKTDKGLKTTQETLTGYNRMLSSLSQQQSIVDNQIKMVQGRITDINSKNIVKQTFYMVDSLPYNTHIIDTARNEDNMFKTYYFKDMQTTLGDKLPKFTTPPFVLQFINNNRTLSAGIIKDVTTESFKFAQPTYSDDNRIIQFNILITEKIK